MTWSIVARDPQTGAIGIAVASRFFAVGARVPFIAPGVGAVATQALINPLYGPKGLDLLRDGASAAEVVAALVADDTGRDHRQVQVMDAQGRFAAHTGAACVDWCGSLSDEICGLAGNMLAGPQVLEETARAYRENADLPFPRRLLVAMAAGEAAGGDKRGKQSAGLLIHTSEDWPDLDIRVDDHPEPIAELARLERVSRERWTHFKRYLATREDPVGITDRARIDAEIAAAIAAADAETGASAA
ncbi:DUF1028 domain-containing protein [Salinarimonas ramus]|uniref:Pilus assembly protein n=1 Tax=Salinarimonas ramus TaxID=690164 RepID=A0A917QBL4_9HYPH|nr:DUF1028 domain-containing protein [Salinarimonas ramus]GGK41777.1 pilus assembly protein [Salinarimonas ramus]